MVLEGFGKQQLWGKRRGVRREPSAGERGGSGEKRVGVGYSHLWPRAGWRGRQGNECARNLFSHRNDGRRGSWPLSSQSWRQRRAGPGDAMAPAAAAPRYFSRLPYVRFCFPFLCTRAQEKQWGSAGDCSLPSLPGASRFPRPSRGGERPLGHTHGVPVGMPGWFVNITEDIGKSSGQRAGGT